MKPIQLKVIDTEIPKTIGLPSSIDFQRALKKFRKYYESTKIHRSKEITACGSVSIQGKR